jgi:hypothetical protein
VKKVHTQHDIAQNLVIVHLDVADSNAQAQDLLELELDRRPYFRQLVAQVLCMSDGSRELSG